MLFNVYNLTCISRTIKQYTEWLKRKEINFSKKKVTFENLVWKTTCLIEGKPTEYFPANSEVEDECAEMDVLNQCDYEKVKPKSSAWVKVNYSNFNKILE